MKNSKNIAKTLLAFVILLTVSVLVPFINMFNISELSQYNNLKIYKEKTEYTEEEKEKISGAYRYLKYSESGKGTIYIEKLLTEEDIEKIQKFDTRYGYYYDYYPQVEENKTKYLGESTNVNRINISEYNAMYSIKYSNYNSIQHKDNAFKITIRYEGRAINTDLSRVFNNYIDNYYNYGYFESNNEIIIDNLRKIIITSYSMYYNEETEEVEDIRISGYLLEK